MKTVEFGKDQCVQNEARGAQSMCVLGESGTPSQIRE